MIVKKAQGRGGGPAGRGHSFKGLSAYLTDKDGQHRAEWIALDNIATDDPSLAPRIMTATARSADALKARAGIPLTGRKSEAGPVYHLVLSWPEDQRPDEAHQQQAARSLLDKLGMARAQAVMVGHSDTGKTHIHVMVNLVDPETGKQFSLGNDQRRMQDWALAYERANGGVQCEQRATNADARAKGEWTRDMRSLSRVSWERMKSERDALFERQSAEREQMYASHGQDWTMAKAEIAARKAAYAKGYRDAYAQEKAAAREEFRPQWRKVFERQKAERISAADLVERLTQETRRAVKTVVSTRKGVDRADRRAQSVLFRKILPAIGIKTESPDQARAVYAAALRDRDHRSGALDQAQKDRTALPFRHDEERKKIAQALDDVVRAKAQLAGENAPLDLSTMKTRHAAEIEATRDRHNAERVALGLKPYEPKPREARPEKAPSVGETPRKPPRPDRRPTPFSLAAAPPKSTRADETERRLRDQSRRQDIADKASAASRDKPPARSGAVFDRAGGGGIPTPGGTRSDEARDRQRAPERPKGKGREDDFDMDR